MGMLVQMCVQGSAMIAAVLVLRALFLHRLPKAAFLALWAVVLARLLIPVSIAAPANAWSLVGQGLELAGVQAGSAQAGEEAAFSAGAASAQDRDGATEGARATAAGDAIDGTAPSAADGETGAAAGTAAAQAPTRAKAAAGAPTAEGGSGNAGTAAAENGGGALLSPWAIGWAAGTGALAIGLVALYLRNARMFARTSPVDNPSARQWLAAHPLRRTLRIREGAGLSSPVAYGVLRPTIAVPVGFDWRNPAKSTLVLEHEFVHVARFDVVLKALLAAAVCAYWFNPLVWAMCLVANRDIELSCDERVARKLNGRGRSLYAHALIDAAAHRASLAPAFAGFGKNAVAERVSALAKVRPATLPGGAATALLAAAILFAFATSAPAEGTAGRQPGAGSAATASAADQTTITDQTVSLVSTERFADTYGRTATRIAVPRYTLELCDALLPNGYAWTFSEAGSAPAPEGSVDVLTITDKATGEICLISYCAPRQDWEGGLATIPGYTHRSFGTSKSDARYYIVVAAPEGSDSAHHLTDTSAYSLQPCADQYGLMSNVYGLEPTDATREAFAARVVEEEGDTRIVTPYFSVLVPGEVVASEEFAAIYSGYSMFGNGELLPALLLNLPGNKSVWFIASPTDASPIGSNEGAPMVATPVVAPNGMQVYVDAAVSWRQNEDGSWYQADQGLESYVGWVCPTSAAESAQTRSAVGDFVQNGLVTWEDAAHSASGASDNDYVAVGSLRGTVNLTTPYYTASIPYDVFLDGFDYAFSRTGSELAPAGATDVLTIADRATGEVAAVFYCYARDSNYPQYSVPGDTGEIPGFSTTDCGRSEGDYGLGCAMAVRGNLDGQGLQLNGTGSMNGVYGLSPVDLPSDAYRARAIAEEDGVRIETPDYSVLVPTAHVTEDLVCAYIEGSAGPEGTHPCHELTVFDPNSGLYLHFYCATDVEIWGGGTTVATDLATPDGLNVYVLGDASGIGENMEGVASWVSVA